jgi:hypothetical protein
MYAWLLKNSISVFPPQKGRDSRGGSKKNYMRRSFTNFVPMAAESMSAFFERLHAVEKFIEGQILSLKQEKKP